MAIQILPQEESFGGSLGRSLGTGLQSLAQHKLNELTQRQNQSKLEQALIAGNFDPGIAKAIAAIPNPDLQKSFVTALIERGGLQASQSNASPSQQFENQYQEQAPQQLQSSVQQQQQQLNPIDLMMQSLGHGQQPLTGQAAAEQFLGNLQQKQVQDQQNAQKANAALAQQAAPVKMQPSTAEIKTPALSKEERIAQHMAKKQPKTLAEVLSQPTRKESALARKEELENRKFELELRKEEADKYKEYKAERKEILEKGRIARQNLKDLGRIEELEEEGKLDTPGYVEFLKRSGLDIPALMEPGSEEFNKITQNFLRDAKTYFGSRVSNFEIEQFLKTIPSLSQSPEGRKRVIANMKYLSRGAVEYTNAYKEILAENKGVPNDLLEQIDDRVESRLDGLYDKFKKDLSKPVPKGQNKFITGLQAVAGSLLGAPGSILGKVGGAISSVVAPV